MAAETAVAAAAVAAYQRLEVRLAAYGSGADPVRTAQLFTRRDPAGRDGVMPLWQQLVAAAEESEQVTAVLSADLSWDDARAALGTTPMGRRFLASLESTARSAGSMAVFAGRTWQEDPELAWQALAGAWRRRRATPNDPVDQRQAALDQLAASGRWKRERLVGAFLIDVPGLLLEHRARDAARLLAEREQLKRTVLRIGGEVRRVHAELGSRLVRRGQLLDMDHVHHMSTAELTAALAGDGPAPAMLATRRRLLDEVAEPAVPSGVSPSDAAPAAEDATSSPGGRRAREPTPAPPGWLRHRTTSLPRETSWWRGRRAPRGCRSSFARVRSSSRRAGRCLTPRSSPASWVCRRS